MFFDMNKQERDKITKVIKAYKDLKATMHSTALHTTRVLERFVDSYEQAFELTNNDENEKSIATLMDTIKFAYMIAEQHKKMQGILKQRSKDLFHSIYLGIDEDETYIKFPEESKLELSSANAFNQITNGFVDICDMLIEYKALLIAKGKPGLANSADFLRQYIKYNLIPYYEKLNSSFNVAFTKFNSHKRGYAVAIQDVPLKVISKKMSSYDIAQDYVRYEEVKVEQTQENQTNQNKQKAQDYGK